MLVAQSMGSHGGQQNFPFGYIPNELHGIGLPDFMTPGPPPGQPLLSEHDTQNLDSFLNGFDTAGDQNKDGSVQQYQSSTDASHDWIMPPTFVGSETSLRPRNGADWQSFQMSDFTFGNDMNMAPLHQSSDFHNGMHGHAFASNGQYDHNLLNQLHNAAQTIQPPFASGWQQNFQPQHAPQVQHLPRPVMRFGSDSHFQPTGYAPPDGQFDPITTPSLDWLEAQSSAANTQPNTEPNTQPSSPSWPKKRKLDDHQTENRRNGFNANLNGQSGHSQPMSAGSISRNKRTLVNHEPPPTPRSRLQTSIKQENEDVADDEDADYDEDNGVESRTRSVSPSSSSKAKVSRTAAKPARVRKKSIALHTPSRSKSKAARNSVGSTPTLRTPLTSDQKKANHTNSEQRRRDATARSYAELYDLVPELDEKGKQSTMKKLEIVVRKVEKVKDRVQWLRTALGFDVDTGAPLQQATLTTDSSRAMDDAVPLSMPSWQQ